MDSVALILILIALIGLLSVQIMTLLLLRRVFDFLQIESAKPIPGPYGPVK